MAIVGKGTPDPSDPPTAEADAPTTTSTDSGVVAMAKASHRRAHERRIAYFMLFRVVMLIVFTVLAAGLTLAGNPPLLGTEAVLVWGTTAVGYAVTIAYARWIHSVRDLGAFAAVQTAIDVVLSAIAVLITGGIDSGLVSLYLISVLGAATMGGRRQIWITAAACTVTYLSFAALELTGLFTPWSLGAPYTTLPVWDAVAAMARTVGGLLGVAVLSSYLAQQVQTSTSQVVSLRALNENIVRSLTSGLITVDQESRVLYFNPTAREILELGDGGVGAPLRHVLPGLGPALARVPDGRIDLQHVLPNGRRIHIGLSRSPLFNAEGVTIGHVIHFQDVTKLHDLSQRVRRSERLAALGGMAASVAHEIRNPLAAISGSAELLSAAKLDEEDSRLLAIIRRESTRLSDMVCDLLAFTRPREPVPVRLELGAAVRETAEAFAADPANADLRVEFSATRNIEVEVDPAQLGQVLWNLMRNGAEAMDARGVLEVCVTADDRDAHIEISDHGKGIEQEHLDTIFDPFFTTKEHGTGFGLAIVHRIVDDNGGSIHVKSNPGAGSTFTVVLPRVFAGDRSSPRGQLRLGEL